MAKEEFRARIIKARRMGMGGLPGRFARIVLPFLLAMAAAALGSTFIFFYLPCSFGTKGFGRCSDVSVEKGSKPEVGPFFSGFEWSKAGASSWTEHAGGEAKIMAEGQPLRLEKFTAVRYERLVAAKDSKSTGAAVQVEDPVVDGCPRWLEGTLPLSSFDELSGLHWFRYGACGDLTSRCVATTVSIPARGNGTCRYELSACLSSKLCQEHDACLQRANVMQKGGHQLIYARALCHLEGMRAGPLDALAWALFQDGTGDSYLLYSRLK